MFTHQQLEQVNAFRMADRRAEVERARLLGQLPGRQGIANRMRRALTTRRPPQVRPSDAPLRPSIAVR